MAKPTLGHAAVQGTIQGVASCRIHRGQLAKAELERGRVFSEVEADFGWGGVPSWGWDRALPYTRPIQSCLNSVDGVGEQ
jgi:hypothetical protein